MRVKEETKMVKQIVTLYVAEDGTEFENKWQCEDYEKRNGLGNLIANAEKLRIAELDDCLPLSNDGLINDNNAFRWYRLENKEDFEAVHKAYGGYCFTEPKDYPEVICVETCGYEPYIDDSYCYYLTDCKIMTEEFWKSLGYKVVFEKI